MEIVTTRGSTELIGAVPLGSGTKSRSYRRNRVCGAGGCSTVLSVYNEGVLCSVHERRFPGPSFVARPLEDDHPVSDAEER
jgi:hypothetical protein